MKESQYEAKVVKKLRTLFPNCIILKTDPTQIQGLPDRLILFEDKWAMLEVKRSMHEPFQPNQEWYISKLNAMSFASAIFPENEQGVLNELQLAFGTRR